MLKVFRDNLKYLSWVLWLVIAVFILFVFVDFGATVPGAPVAGNAAVTVGDQEISYGDFERAYRQAEDSYRQAYGERFSGDLARQLGLHRQVLDGLVAEKILIAEAERMGLVATDAEVRRAIMELPVFRQENGAFIGREAYQNLLRRYGYHPEMFEEEMRQDLLSRKVRAVLTQNAFVSAREVEETYRRNAERARVRFVELATASLAGEVDVAPEEVAAHFAEHAEDFRVAERRVVDYLLVDQQQVAEALVIDPQGLRAYYDEHLEDFQREEEVRARHILVQINQDRDREAALAELEAARRRVAAGEDFAAVAAAISEDPGSRARGGNLGFFGRGQMVPPFEEAAFGGQVGTLIGPVETSFGVHLIEVLERRPAGTEPFAEAEETIRQQLLAERAESAARSKAEELAQRAAGEPEVDFGALAENAGPGVSYQRTPPFTRDDNVPGIGRSTAFSVEAFELAAAGVSEPVRLARGWAVLRLAKVEGPRLPALEEVRPQVETAVVAEKSRALALARLAELAASAPGLDQIADRLGLEIEESAEFGAGGAVGSLGANAEVVDAALALDEGALGGPVATADGAVLFEVVSRQRFDAERFAEERDETRATLEVQRANELLASLIERRRRELSVRYDPQLLETFELDPGVASG